ncbi:MAG: glycosyltransferase [Kiritimatiellia bacterium]|nr:glycosyltransferase [Lentisphaerota bacterium]
MADRRLRVVLVHDWLTGMRGGERVLEVLCRMFPAAPIYTLISNPGQLSEFLCSHPIHTSCLQRMPGVMQHYRRMLPLFPAAIESLRLPPADLVISTSHCVAKGVRPPPGARHICYCFTPMRYAWVFYEEYFGGSLLKGLLLKPLLAQLRRWDRRVCDRVDMFVTLSEHVRARIRCFYEREAEIVYAPINTDFWTPDPENAPPGDYDLMVSALVPYKRIDLAVRSYTRSGMPLKIVGVGTEYQRLRAGAGANIEFLGRVNDDEVRRLYRKCRLLVFPGEEDFGLVPLEVQACGRPVVAYGRGGALETVVDGKTGLLFAEQTEDALQAAVARAAAMPWDRDVIRRHAEQFGDQQFIDGMFRCIETCLG